MLKNWNETRKQNRLLAKIRVSDEIIKKYKGYRKKITGSLMQETKHNRTLKRQLREMKK